MVASVVKEEALTLDEVRAILDEASQVVVYSHRLEQKSRELEAATAELREANERLKELDRLKDDFVSTVTHELRTPLTSIRTFSRSCANPARPPRARAVLDIVIKETERLTRLINQMLDLAKLESGNAEWHSPLDMHEVIEDTVAPPRKLSAKAIALSIAVPPEACARPGRPRPHGPGAAQPPLRTR